MQEFLNKLLKCTECLDKDVIRGVSVVGTEFDDKNGNVISSLSLHHQKQSMVVIIHTSHGNYNLNLMQLIKLAREASLSLIEKKKETKPQWELVYNLGGIRLPCIRKISTNEIIAFPPSYTAKETEEIIDKLNS